MYQTLLRQSWLQFVRSSNLGRNVATLIFIGFLCLMFGAYILLLAFFLENILQEFSGQGNAFALLNSILIYYFLAEILMRYFMQSLPVLNVQPFLHLPISRIKLVNFLIWRSYTHPLNFLSAVFFLPYTLHALVPAIGMGAAWQWWSVLVLCSLIINGLMFFFKKHLDDKPAGTIILILLAGTFAGSQFFGWFSLGEFTAPFFLKAAEQAWLPLLLLGLLVMLFVLNSRFLQEHIYPEDWAGKKERLRHVPALGFLRSLGAEGELIGLEWRLIIRHKRSRSVLFLTVFALLYGLIFYNNPEYHHEKKGFLLFVGIFITGIFMINFGQLLYSWNSSHYDFYLSKPLAAEQYVRAKYYLLSVISVGCFMLSIPYVYFGWEVLMINACMLLFNLGVNVFVVMNIAMWGPKKLNLANGSVFNYQGLGAAQWVMAIPVFLLPYLFYTPLSFAGYPRAGILLLGFIGLLGILLQKNLIGMTARRLQLRKYRIAHTFRNE
jgi:hypothetical protein